MAAAQESTHSGKPTSAAVREINRFLVVSYTFPISWAEPLELVRQGTMRIQQLFNVLHIRRNVRSSALHELITDPLDLS